MLGNDVVTATLNPTDSVLRYTVKTELNKDGNLVSIREGKDPQSLSDSIVNTYYTAEDKDREGLLKTIDAYTQLGHTNPHVHFGNPGTKGNMMGLLWQIKKWFGI